MEFITYSSREEIIITTEKEEQEAIREFFTEGGRDLDDYDREIYNGSAIGIGNTVRIL